MRLAGQALDRSEIGRKDWSALLEKTEAGRRPVRLLGAGVYNLEPLVAAGVVNNTQLKLET